MKAHGYSLWIMPKGEVYEVLQKTINALAERYSAPVFNPHITLVAELESSEEEIIKKAKLISDNITPFQVKFEKIDFQDYYFRCLYLKVKLSDEIVNLHEKAKHVFQVENMTTFMPHISLLYGDYSTSTKQKIIQELEGKFNFDFTARSIDIFHTVGEADEWVKVREAPFKK